MATRRSHIVRCYDDSSGKVDKGSYIDVEVLDAISFKIKNGEEVILNFPAKKAAPFIKDDTGNGLDQSPGSATRRSHVKHIKGDSGELLVEVLDAIAFKDKRGEEWILKMPSAASNHYNVTKGTGDGSSTMRTHNEKIGLDPKEHHPKTDYLTVERSDMIAFRSVNGREMILKMPSGDDGGSIPRSDTHIWSPESYDPTNEDAEVPENKDPDFYVKFVKGKSPLTGDELISQGPLWWIRKVSGAPWLVIQIDLTRVANDYTFDCIAPDGTEYDGFMTNRDPKLMPFVEGKGASAKPDGLDLTKDVFLRGNTEGGLEKATGLIFINLKDKAKDGINVQLKFPALPQLKPTPGTIGYFVWAISGNDGFNGVPIHPAPDASNALGPYPFGDVGGIGMYITLWNNWHAEPFTWSNQVAAFRAFGIPVPPEPTGIYGGWTDAAGAEAFKNAINALDTAIYQQALAEAQALHQSINISPPVIFETLTINFGGGGNPTPMKLDAKITAMKYSGRVNFPFDENNKLLFDPPQGQNNTKITNVHQVEGGGAHAVDVTWDGQNGLTISG